MNILLLASHGIAEYDDIRMFHHLGFDVFCPGGYANPATPGETLRPALPEVPYHADLAELCEVQRRKHPEPPGEMIDWAKAHLHPDLVDWADAIIVHHFVDRWIGLQWPRIGHKRVIWRTCGQSNPALEQYMARFRAKGLQIVRYSPREAKGFGAMFAGQDALIRFGKFTDDYGSWIGDEAVVGNVTQHMVERGDATGYGYWLAATDGLPTKPAGPGSEQMRGGVGALDYAEMREYLRHLRAYLYTGTVPASYTLGLIEAMLTGVPIVTMNRRAFGVAEPLYEADEIVPRGLASSDPDDARNVLSALLAKRNPLMSELVRKRATELFGMEVIGPQWQEFLS